MKNELVRRWLCDFEDVELADIIPSPQEYFYRNRVTLHHDGKNFGFYRGRTHEIVAIQKCVIASDLINQKISALKNDVLSGPQTFEIREDDASVFLQVNLFQNRNLIETVLEFCRGKKSQNILELFCGVGNLTFALSEVCHKITAVDSDRAAIKMAEQKRLKLKNKKINFIAGDASDFVFKMSQNLEKTDVIVCDPPRAGLKSAAKSLCQLETERIVYVSCNLESFFKDAKILRNKKYYLKKLVPLDMFPQTHHVELVGLFSV